MIRETWRSLSAFMANPRRQILGLASASLVGGLAEAVVLVLVVSITLVATGQTETVGPLPVLGVELSATHALVVAAVLAVANIAVHYVTARLIGRLGTSVQSESRTAAINAFLHADWNRQSLEREGRLHETVAVLSTNAAQATMSIATGVTAALQLTALMTVALLVDPLATLIVVVSGLVLFAGLRPMSLATRRRSAAFLDATGDLLTSLTRSTGMAMELRAFGVTETERLRLERQVRDTAERNRKMRVASRFGQTLYRDLAIAFLVGAVGLLYLLGPEDIGAVGAVVLLVIRAANSSQGLQVMRQQVSEWSPDVERLIERIDSLRADAHQGGSTPTDHLGAIRLEQMSYAYGDTPALEAVDLEILPGESIGIVGPSGGGKSTLMQVLMRLRTPTDGTVAVDGLDYRCVRDSDWARLVALVPQEPHLMEGTVRENAVFHRDGVSDREIEHACRLAHIWDEIQRLPHGLDTTLGARGSGISGGQKQRLAIARALIGSPELLVLDEPTSALDAASEERLRDTLSDLHGSLSIVIVTHRPVPLSVCDRVVQVVDGQLSA